MKELGLTLDQAGKMASQLLDFEQSISKELEAELLTGKDLNLEKARLLALQGKNTEAAAELAKQVGGTAELSRMNVIQQEALASAMGMERNELIQSVQKREILARLGATSIEQLKERGELDKLNSSELGKQLLAQYEQESAAAKFESAVIKIQEAIGSMMEGPFGTFIDLLSSAVSSAGTMYTIMGGLAAMGFGRMIAQLGTMVALQSAGATAAMTTAGALTLGLGLVAIVGAVAVAMSSMESQAQSSAMNLRNVNDVRIRRSPNMIIEPNQKGSLMGAREDIEIGAPPQHKKESLRDVLLDIKEKLNIGNKERKELSKKGQEIVIHQSVPGPGFEQRQLNKTQNSTTSVG